MPLINLTDSEVRVVRNLITRQREHYGPLKKQFSEDIKSYIRSLNSIKKALAKERQEVDMSDVYDSW